MSEMDHMSWDVPDFYKGERVLITGFTGYLGKLVVEKLLSACPEVDRVYVIIRSRKGVGCQERMQKVLSSRVFDSLRKQHPERLQRVVGVAGDLSQEDLGLSEQDALMLAQDTTIVLHCAASVRFDDPLSVAAQINIRGSLALLQLTKGMPNRKCFVHVSTAYVNSDRKNCEECLYTPKMDWKDFLAITSKIDDATLNILTAKMIAPMPNTYVFTKSLAEHSLNDMKEHLPLVICRPSIVSPAKEEPVPGWTDTVIGLMGLSFASILGVNRVQLINNNSEGFDCIYSDYVVKGIIASPSLLQPCGDTTICHLCASKTHLSTSKKFIDACELSSEFMENLDANNFYLKTTGNKYVYMYFTYIYILSSFFIDSLMSLAGQKPMLVKLRRKLYSVENTVDYFQNQSMHFETKNYRRIQSMVQNNKLFYFDLDTPPDYSIIMYHAIKVGTKELFPEIFDNVSTSRKYLKMLYYIDLTAELLSYAAIFFFLYNYSIPQLMLRSLSKFFSPDFLM